MEDCELCGNRFNLGIAGNTIVMEDNKEYKICSYCQEEFIKNYTVAGNLLETKY